MKNLRLGIVPLDFEIIAKSFEDQSEGFSYDHFHFPEYVLVAAKMGYKVIEITLDMAFIIPNAVSKEIIEALKAIRHEYKISYTAHLPLWSIEPASPVSHIRNASVDTLVEAFNIIEDLKPEYYVLHATGALAAEFSRLNAGNQIKDLLMQLLSGHAADSLEKFISRTGIDPKRIAIEDIEFPWGYTRMLVDEYDTSICFDTGHLLAGYPGEYDFMEFLKMNSDKIREIHLHDGYRIEKNGQISIADHIALGDGNLPLKEFCNWIKETNFDGPVIFEQSFKNATKSLQKLKEVCPELL